MKSPLLEVQHLTVDYLTSSRCVRAVDDVSFTIYPGEIVGLAGESGCGKSTAAHAILRILRSPAAITGGQILFQGRDVLTLDQEDLRRFRWRYVSLVLQSAMNALNPVLSVGDQFIDTIQAHDHVNRTAALDRAGDLLTMVGIDRTRLKSYPHELSGGMRQRIVIALALALQPELIIMDEPTTALDVVVQREILQEIEDLQRKLGFAVLFITHDLSLLVEFCHRIGIMYAGEIVETAEAEKLFRVPLHPYTLGLMHSFPSLTGERKELTGIPGSPPDLGDPPTGCRFHPRCPRVAECTPLRRPPLHAVDVTHLVACHLAGGPS